MEGGGGDPNDIMGLRRDLNKGLVSGSQQLKWERNQYLDDEGGDDADGDGGRGGGRGGRVVGGACGGGGRG